MNPNIILATSLAWIAAGVAYVYWLFSRAAERFDRALAPLNNEDDE